MDMQVVELIFNQLMMMGLLITAPILIITFLAAVVIGIIQSMMQIQEQTLSFAPKMILLAVLLMLMTPMIFDNLVTMIQESMELALEIF